MTWTIGPGSSKYWLKHSNSSSIFISLCIVLKILPAHGGTAIASSVNVFSPGAVASLTPTKQNYCKKDQTSYLDPHSKSDKWRLTRIPYQKCINHAGDCYILLLGVGVDPTYSKITHLSLHFLGQTFTTSTNQKLNIIQSCECWKGSQTPRRSSMCPCFGPLFQLLVFLEKKHNDSVLRASLRMGKYMEHPVKICFSRSWSKI